MTDHNSDPDKIVPPWSAEQVAGLNGYQRSGVFHPYTCGDASCRADLVATRDGWRCPHCSYRQTWAHAFSVDGWKEIENIQVGPAQEESR